ncbi:Acb2/Tad1 domain-containing protein [Hymenobacter sp. HD11105]
MTTITPGHTYELKSLEGGQPQTLQFIQKQMIDGQFVTVQDGTTNEEVIEALLDRLRVQSAKLPSRETALAITKFEEGLMWLELRSKNRQIRGVEGTPHA